MNAIPIYDATAPIVCTAGGAELPKRIEQIERLRACLTGVDRGEHGLLLRFPNRAEVADELERFAIEEKGCCRFWGFEIATLDDELVLRWDAPPTAGELVERLLGYFKGDEPLSAVSGLL